MSEEQKLKIGKSAKGREAWNKGKSFSTEIKSKMSQNRKGLTAWNKGKSLSESHKKNIQLAKLRKNGKLTIDKDPLTAPQKNAFDITKPIGSLTDRE